MKKDIVRELEKMSIKELEEQADDHRSHVQLIESILRIKRRK